MDLKSTLNLPNPDFTIPMKADLARREPEIQARWDEIGIYHEVLRARADAPTFVLHDGPPYTNSPIHMGTALNKVLKDFVVKSRTMMGYACPYVPGFDSHGLPIEQAVLKAFHERKEHPDVPTLRAACREHAKKYLDIQTGQFKRLGVFGLWERPYSTIDYRFEAGIVRVFGRLVAGGYVYRGLRPVQWSPTARTALADTEIVYMPHRSRAIYVRFRLKHDPNRLFEDNPDLSTIIWTTTPWTIPANLAVAFHPELEYAIVRLPDGARYLVLEALVPKLTEDLGWESPVVERTLQGINLDHAVFEHPIYHRDSLAVMAEYVTTEDGTGVVHTAPGHGRDDFYTGLRYGLPILCPVDERGVLTEEAGEFSGVFYRDCDKVVVDRLAEIGALLKAYDYEHSYPHGERDGQPVIFRATEQWFVNIDHDGLRARMLDEDGGVSWLPENGEARIRSMVAGRPDWCISRQRPWGVGIPVFYGAHSREPVLDPEVIEAVARLIDAEGSDAWFTKPASEILPPGYRHPDTGETEFLKETDVLDVWFDSGSTNLVVLEGECEPAWTAPWPADLYLEGSDQHRGWFDSSLVIATATRGGAPYRAVATHGFVVDDQGRKMSKRLGNVIDPVQACETYGADVLRYWAASVDWTNDVPCTDAILKQFGESYRRVRNTLRFLLGNLEGFDPNASFAFTHDVDEWIVEQTDLLAADCADPVPETQSADEVGDYAGHYARYDFGAALGAIHNFCVQQLSSFYLDAIKDRMYCDGGDWPTRRSAQAACHYVLNALVRLLAPILPHTAEEVYAKMPVAGERLLSIHMAQFPLPDEDRLAEIQENDLQQRVAELLEARAEVFAAFEGWKGGTEPAAEGAFAEAISAGSATWADGNLSRPKDSQDVMLVLAAGPERRAALASFGEDLPNLMKFSAVELREGEPSIAFAPSIYPKCERSRLRRPDAQQVEGVWLTARDRRAIGR